MDYLQDSEDFISEWVGSKLALLVDEKKAVESLLSKKFTGMDAQGDAKNYYRDIIERPEFEAKRKFSTAPTLEGGEFIADQRINDLMEDGLNGEQKDQIASLFGLAAPKIVQIKLTRGAITNKAIAQIVNCDPHTVAGVLNKIKNNYPGFIRILKFDDVIDEYDLRRCVG